MSPRRPAPDGSPALDRRAFLGVVAGAALVGCREATAPAPAPTTATSTARTAPPPPPAIRRGTAYGPGRYEATGNGTNFVLSRVNLDAVPLRAQPMRMPFFGHGLAFDPLDSGRALVFEKHGPGCCEVDLRAGKVKRMVPTRPGRQFYGHGVFSPDGKRLFCTETEVDDGTMRGVIAVRDGRTLEPLDDLPSGGAAPHDCVLSGDGRSLVVTHGGGDAASQRTPCVTWISLATGAIERTLPFSDPTINAGHLQLAANGDLVVVSAPRDGLEQARPEVHGDVSFWRGEARDGGQLRAAGGAIVAKMRAETLSLALVPANHSAVVTNPEGNLLSSWSVATGELLQAVTSYTGPRGVALALDGSCLVLTHGKTTGLTLLDPTKLAPLADGTLERSWMSGSHVVVHAVG